MNNKEFIRLLRKVIREEVTRAVKKEMKPILTEIKRKTVVKNQSLKKTGNFTNIDDIVQSVLEEERSNIVEEDTTTPFAFSNDTMLNSVLNETLNQMKSNPGSTLPADLDVSYDPHQAESWPEMRQAPRRTPMPGYAKEPTINEMIPNDLNIAPEQVDPAVAKALTRDYSALMKKINNG